MKKTLFLLLLASLLSSAVSAQAFLSRVYIGGSAGVSVNSNYTDIAIHPIVGYRITDIISVGVLATYQYTYGKGNDRKANHYGGGIFWKAEVPIIPRTIGLVAHAEYSFLNSNIKEKDKEWSEFNNFLPVGVGLYTQSGRTRVSLVALWDLFHLKQYDSGGPTLRASITF